MAHGSGEQDIMMMTTDVALVTDANYRKYVEEFANDEDAFADAFAKVWYKLVNRDCGPHSRLVGPDVPPPQDWQFPLPETPDDLADMSYVEKDINKLLDEGKLETKELVRLARNSANTYRHTDYLGGVNGARIRFSPGKDWQVNEGLDTVLETLQPVKDYYGTRLSWADLIVVAGNTGLKKLGVSGPLSACPGRTDASNGKGWEPLSYMNEKPPATIEEVKNRNALRGLSNKEMVALTFPDFPSVKKLSNLLESTEIPTGIESQTLKFDPEIKRWVEFYISAGEEAYEQDFCYAWTKLMNLDRFDGPVHNKCLRHT